MSYGSPAAVAVLVTYYELERTHGGTFAAA